LNANQLYVVDRLKAVEGAAFNSRREEYETECHPGTRVDTLDRIDEWANSAEGKCIFWLNGMAGTGKSTISRTVARKLSNSQSLGASFFFKRDAGERSNAARLVTTIASQLAEHLPSMSEHVRKAIEAYPRVDDETVKEKFEKLILEPLRKVDKGPKTSLRTLVIVIDALDECDQENDVADIIDLLLKTKQSLSIQLKFFVTSRPEVPIRNKFDDIGGFHDDVALHEVPGSVIKDDISLFLKHSLEEFRDKPSVRKGQKLPVDWPGQEKIEKLVEMAIPLFIFATTAIRFIEDLRLRGDPNSRLENILEYKALDHTSKFGATYLPALHQMLYGLEGEDKSHALKEFGHIVGSIVVLANPLSAVSLASLLGILIKDVDNRLYWLHSVLNVPSESGNPVTLFHLSFRDFLVHPDKRANEFWVNEREANKELASKCLDLMSKTLTKDICNQEKPGTLRESIGKETIDRCLAPQLQYACLYWVQHLQKSDAQLSDNDPVHDFLQKHLLHWFEALGWMGKISDGIHVIATLESFAAVSMHLAQHRISLTFG
jgi:NACHT domain